MCHVCTTLESVSILSYYDNNDWIDDNNMNHEYVHINEGGGNTSDDNRIIKYY